MVRAEFFKPGHDYRNRGTPNAPDDQFMRWINHAGSGMENGPGIRPLRYFSPPSFTDLPAFLVLLTKKSSQGGSYKPWQDIIDREQGTVLYWGDAKLNPEKHYTDFRGNRILKGVWNAIEAGRRSKLSPILHFEKNKTGWVTFTGLCALTALWPDHFEEKGQLVENYRCRLRALGSAWDRGFLSIQRLAGLFSATPWSAPGSTSRRKDLRELMRSRARGPRPSCADIADIPHSKFTPDDNPQHPCMNE